MGRRPFVRQRVLEAAFDLFATQGYEAVATRDIAAAAGVGAASMFKHFPTKEALARELYRLALEPLLVRWHEIAAAQGPAPSVVRSLLHLLYAAYDHRPRALALLIFPPHEFTPWELDPANPASPRSGLRAVLDGDDDLAAIVWGAITGPLHDRYLRRRLGTMEPYAAAHAERVTRLLEPSPEPA